VLIVLSAAASGHVARVSSAHVKCMMANRWPIYGQLCCEASFDRILPAHGISYLQSSSVISSILLLVRLCDICATYYRGCKLTHTHSHIIMLGMINIIMNVDQYEQFSIYKYESLNGHYCPVGRGLLILLHSPLSFGFFSVFRFCFPLDISFKK